MHTTPTPKARRRPIAHCDLSPGATKERKRRAGWYVAVRSADPRIRRRQKALRKALRRGRSFQIERAQYSLLATSARVHLEKI